MKSFLVALSSAVALCLAACSSVPAGAAKPEAATGVSEITMRERVQLVVQLLDQGEEKRALAEIDTLLSENPDSSIAINLRNQVTNDPQKILGASYKTYTALPGDTISSLAKTYLGDAMLFYALSRYNELPAPNRLMVGQSLKLPDKFAGAPKRAAAIAVAPNPVETSRKATVQDVESARSLRLEALEHLNKGNADQAVAQLEKATRLDSGNKSIAADLARAQRIQQALRKPD